MKKLTVIALAIMLVASAFAGCAPATPSPAPAAPTAQVPDAQVPAAPAEPAAPAAASGMITVVSREDGSGTRGAFIELLGIMVKTDAGSEDMTTQEAIIQNGTDGMLSTVAGDPNAIGYVSLGSLNDTVKALDIDGVAATVDNVKNDTYPIKRPFNIATKGEPTGVAADFISFIMSKEGQAVVSGSYIAIDENAPAFTSANPSGTITVAGSSSVSPIMEKLIEAYKAINSAAEIELQTSDSSAGMTAAIDGMCEIGMASRALKDTESAELTGTTIAIDGIAVIASASNPTAGVSSEQARQIFTGEVTDWSAIG